MSDAGSESQPVTVVLCDIANSAQLGERLDAEVLRAIMSRYSREMRGALERHGGRIEKLIGNAVMGVFSEPLPALTAAADMGDVRDELNAELEADWGVRISTRTGVSTGEELDDAVNLATRLEQTATVGEVWVGETTMRLVGSAAEFEDAGLMRVKGKGEAVHAWRLLASEQQEEEKDDHPELEWLEAAFERAVADQACRVVTAEGEPRLVDEFVERMGDRAGVARGRCSAFADPLAAVAEAVGDLDIERPLLPEERFAAVHQALERAAGERPLVVVFEDVDAGQRTFCDLLDHLPRLPSHTPVLIVSCAREPGELPEPPPPPAELVDRGRRAHAVGDLPTAADLLRRAVTLLPEDDPQRPALLTELGEALCDLGELAAADAVLTDAVEEARAVGDRRVETRSDLARAYATSFTGAGSAVEHLRETAERAATVFGELGDDAGLARAWHALGTVHACACRWGAAEEARRHGLEHARAAGERRLELRALPELAYALYFGPAPVDSAIEAVEQEILPRTRGFPVAEGAVLGVLGGLMSMQGRFDEARELHANAREILSRLGPAPPVAEGALNASDTELLADDPEQAELVLRAAYATTEAADETAIRTSVAAALAQALAARGHDDEALAFTEDSERMAAAGDIQPQVTWRAVRSSVLARRDEAEEAERLAHEAVELARATDDPNLLALALLAAGEVDEAAELYEAKGNTAALAALSRSAGP